jgi:hypothetical protein
MTEPTSDQLAILVDPHVREYINARIKEESSSIREMLNTNINAQESLVRLMDVRESENKALVYEVRRHVGLFVPG